MNKQYIKDTIETAHHELSSSLKRYKDDDDIKVYYQVLYTFLDKIPKNQDKENLIAFMDFANNKLLDEISSEEFNSILNKLKDYPLSFILDN